MSFRPFCPWLQVERSAQAAAEAVRARMDGGGNRNRKFSPLGQAGRSVEHGLVATAFRGGSSGEWAVQGAVQGAEGRGYAGPNQQLSKSPVEVKVRGALRNALRTRTHSAHIHVARGASLCGVS